MMVLTPYKSRSFASHQPHKSQQFTSQQPQTVHLSPNSIVPLLPNSLWLVKQGMVKLSADTEDGDCVLLGLVGTEETFGASLTSVETFNAVTLCECELICFNLNDIASSTDLSLVMMRAVGARLRQSETLLSIVGQRRVEDRVRCFLEMLAHDYGIMTPDGIRINVRLTQQDIANALSTTRVTVTRVIGQLKKEGWLKSSPQRYFIIQRDMQLNQFRASSVRANHH